MGTRGRVALALLLLSALLLTYTFRDELQAAHDALQLTSEHRPLGRADRDAPVKSVTVFRNGFSTGGVEMELSAAVLAAKWTRAGDLAAYLSQFVAVEGPFTSDAAATNDQRSDTNEEETDDNDMDDDVARVVADRVFTGRGDLVQTFFDVRSGDVLYLVAPGLSFMWPFVALGHRVVVTLETGASREEPVVIESISETPRTFRLHHFFRDDEADRLIQQTRQRGGGEDGSQPSSRDAGSGKRRKTGKTKARAGESVFDAASDTAVAIRKRVLQVLSLGQDSDEKAAGLELLQYQSKQAYVPHDDYFLVGAAHEFGLDLPQGGSERFATVFLHLSDVARGGQTVFPLADMPAGGGLPAEYGHPLHAARDYGAAGAELFAPGSPQMDMVQSCSTKLAFYPSRGSAVLFYSQKPNGEPDPMSLYGGCPVIEGVKWGASLRVGKRHHRDLHVDPLACSVTFINPTSRAVKLYWSDKLMSTLAASGGSITYNSFTNHKWVLKAGDRVLLEYVVDATGGDKQTVTVPPVHEDATNQPAAGVIDEANKHLSTNADTRDEL